VTFSDGSKVCVKACKKDTFNKETGLIYAIIKRLYANDVEKKTGYLRATGLGEKINKLLNNATDQKEVERERRRKQKAKQAKKEAEKKEEAGEAKEPEEKIDEKQN
jgi:predicted nucleotidyltransferase